jgi:ABC-type glycerol-3-phosphate transport system substrate-binding protein
MKNHPGVKVEVAPNDEDGFVNQYLLAWSHGRNPVDLGIGGTPGQLAAFVAKDDLTPWTDFFTGSFAKDSFIPAYREQGVFKGTQYTLPFMGEVMMFSINKPMFQKAGLLGADGQAVAPKTWGDLQKADRGEQRQAGLLDPLGLQLRRIQLSDLPAGRAGNDVREGHRHRRFFEPRRPSLP